MSTNNIDDKENICITAILPLFECEDAVEDAIAEIRQQSYENWKLILVDDGSTDDTAEICMEYVEADSRIILLSNEESLGSAACYGKGLESAEEGYVLFLDPTDGVEPELFETIAASAHRQASDVITFGIAALQYTLEGELRQEVEHAIPTRFWKSTNTPADLPMGQEAGADDWNSTISELSEQSLLDPYWNKAYLAEFLKTNGLDEILYRWESEEHWTEEVLGKVNTLTVLGDILYDRIFWYEED